MDTTQNGYEFYLNDAWRLSSHADASARASTTRSTARRRRSDDRYAYLIDNATGEILDVQTLSVPRARRGRGGPALQPDARVPAAGRLRTRPLLRHRLLEPRTARRGRRGARRSAAGIGEVLFGAGRGVLRGGYALVFDRQNNVNLGSWQMGVAFGQTLAVNAPRCNCVGTPGADCVAAGTRSGRRFPGRRRWSRCPTHRRRPLTGADRPRGAVRRLGDAPGRSGSEERPDAQLQPDVSAGVRRRA